MRDSEQHYPIHQPDRNGRQHPFDDDDEGLAAAIPDLEEEAPRRRRGAPSHQRNYPTTPQLPPGRVRNAVIIGAIAGVLSEVQSIIITLLNASTFNTISKLGAKTPYATALTAFGISVLTFFIGLLIIFVGGLIVGRVVVQRRMGFVAGFMAGLVNYLISFLTNYIPNFPGHLAASGSTNPGAITGGIFAALISMLIWGVIGGLVSLLGTWLATRHHPYYVGYER